MNRQETMSTPYGEFMDMIDCLAIENGANQVKKKWTFDEVMRLE